MRVRQERYQIKEQEWRGGDRRPLLAERGFEKVREQKPLFSAMPGGLQDIGRESEMCTVVNWQVTDCLLEVR